MSGMLGVKNWLCWISIFWEWVCDQSHDFESSEYRLVPEKRL